MYTQFFHIFHRLIHSIHSRFCLFLEDFIKKVAKWLLFRYKSILLLQRLSQDGFCGIGIQAHIRCVSRQIFIIGLGSDHGAVISA